MSVVSSSGAVVQLAASRPAQFNPIRTALSVSDQMLDYAAIWRTQHNVRTVVDFLARNIASLPIKLYRRTDDDDRERLTDHAFVHTLRRPNVADRRLTRYRFIYQLVVDICVYDLAFHLFARAGDQIALVRVPPRNMEISAGSWLWPDRYRVRGTTGYRDFAPDSVAHYQGSLNLDDPRFGAPPIESLRAILSEETSATQFRDQFWRRSARTSGVLERPVAAGRWKPGTRERFRNEWHEAYTGEGAFAGGTPILEDGMQFRETTSSMREAQYLEARKLTREEVAAAYHVHPAFVGILEHANFSNMREQHNSLYQDTLGPWIVMLEEDLETQVLPEFDADPTLYVEFDFKAKLRGSLVDEADSIAKLTGAPILTRNEGRALINRNALPEGEGLVTPLNVIIGGQTIAGEAPIGAIPRETGTEARPVPGRKALIAGAGLIDNYTTAHRVKLESFFARQRAEVLSELGARGGLAGVSDIFDKDRWDAELSLDLAGLALVTSRAFWDDLADTYGLDLSVIEDVDAYLTPLALVNSEISAKNINATTESQISTALVDNIDPANAVRDLFIGYAAVRAAEIGKTRTTWASNYGRTSAAQTGGLRRKVWNVTSPNPRPSHAALNGETVPMGETFSNGGAWPGDPSMGVAETAGCTCTLSYTT